jgi:aspartate aminotransferase
MTTTSTPTTSLFESLPVPRPDPIFAISAAFKEDPRTTKLDLAVGVYRNDEGVTPVFAAVQKAEERLAAEGESKEYRGLAGNLAFNAAYTELLLASPALIERAATVQSVGGTGALRLLCDFIRFARPETTIWTSDPGYGNHEPLFRAAGLKVRKYRYLGANGKVDGETMFADLDQVAAGDVVVLHGCCHNPTGADLTPALWMQAANLFEAKGALPFVDLAYQGLGDSLDADAAGLRHLATRLPEVVVSASCSKNFGLYNERTGAATVIVGTPSNVERASGTLQITARTNYSMPPDHGAAVANEILHDPELMHSWSDELTGMRERILAIRADLAAAFAEKSDNPALQALRDHRGMFSLLPLSADHMRRLRAEFGVYGTDAGRINIAGLNSTEIPYLVESVVAVL